MKVPRYLTPAATVLLLMALAVPILPATPANAAQDYDDYNSEADYDAQDDVQPFATRVGRIRSLEGQASLRTSESSEWEAAGANLPIFQGDELLTDRYARVEIQLGGGRSIFLGGDTNVTFALVDEHAVRVEMPAGSAVVWLDKLDDDESFEISAPAAAVTIREEGLYRIDVDDEGNTQLAVREGSAEMNGVERAFTLEEGDTARFDYNDPYDVDLLGRIGYDGLDTWSADQIAAYENEYRRSRDHIGQLGFRNDIYGLVELASYGRWISGGSYGQCWQPYYSSGWQPYSNGYWQWYPGYGYTWVSNEPWGWAPYHYGRWQFLSGHGWVWVPWSNFGYGNYYWTPAQVYWYQYPGYGGYAWVPLAPNEPYVGYRSFRRRHQRDFTPIHLRTGRAIGLTQNTGRGRLKPTRVPRDFGGRTPVAVVPEKPKSIDRLKPRFDTSLSEDLRGRSIVVKNTTIVRTPAGGVESGTTRRRPVKAASEAAPKPVRVDRPATMTDSKPVTRPGRDPVIRTAPSGNEPAVKEPRRPVERAEPVEPRTTKPRRAEPADPPATVDRPQPRPRVEPTPRAEPKREAPPRRAEPAPRAEPKREAPPRRAEPAPRPKPEARPRENRNVERSQPKPDRNVSAPRVERVNPPAKSNDGGGNKGNKGHKP